MQNAFGVPVSDWTLNSAGVDNALATVTKAAVPGQNHYVTSISFSYSAAAVGKLATLKDNGNVIKSWYVHSYRDISFDTPILISNGSAVSVELAASGTPGQLGAVTVNGFTRG